MTWCRIRSRRNDERHRQRDEDNTVTIFSGSDLLKVIDGDPNDPNRFPQRRRHYA